MCNISVVCLQLDLNVSLARAPCCEFSPHLLHLSTRSRPPHQSYRVIVPSLQDAGRFHSQKNEDFVGVVRPLLPVPTPPPTIECVFQPSGQPRGVCPYKE